MTIWYTAFALQLANAYRPEGANFVLTGKPIHRRI